MNKEQEKGFQERRCDNIRLNEDTLKMEREKASFCPNKMKYFLHGGKNGADAKEKVMVQLERDPIFAKINTYERTVEQNRATTMARFLRALEYYKEAISRGDNDTYEALSEIISVLDPSIATKFGVHFLLFKGCVEGNGTQEQVKQLSDDISNLHILGCFGMTELGHGSNIPAFETTSTFDKKNQQFILNTPTETATKWWIGGASQTATHCTVYARLIIDEKDYGVHAFLVQLRKLEDHSLMPGIVIGDCGPKMGRNGIDNGFIQFNSVRIPRDQMLMKYSRVTPDGRYEKSGFPQLAYGALIAGRVEITKNSANFLKIATTIATRYSAVRRQFPLTSGNEIQILDYATHQNKLFPLIAAAYAMHFTVGKLNKDYEDTMERLKKGDTSTLKDIHSTSAGLKAHTTWLTHYGIDTCRQSLGGHGYSSYTGLSQLFNDFAVQCSWEGDNTVMCQQTARYLMSAIRRSMSGKEVGPTVNYLTRIGDLLTAKMDIDHEDQLLDPLIQIKAWEWLVVKVIMSTAQNLQEKMSQKGVDKKLIWNDHTVELVECSKVHCYYYMIKCFIDTVMTIEDISIKKTLKRLCDFWTLYNLDLNMNHLFEGGFINQNQSKMIKNKISQLRKEIRSEAVALVDAFHYTDYVINSPFGRYDGNVYSHYLEKAKSCPYSFVRASYWEDLIKPLTQQKSKL